MAMAMIDPPVPTTEEESKPENINAKICEAKPIGVEVIISSAILMLVALNNLLMCGGTLYGEIFVWSTDASAGNSKEACNLENDYCNKYCGLEPGDDDGDIDEDEEISWEKVEHTLEWLQVYLEAAHQLVFAFFLNMALLNNKRGAPRNPWTWKSFACAGLPLFFAFGFCIIRLAVIADYRRFFVHYFFEIAFVQAILLFPEKVPFVENMVNLSKQMLDMSEATLKTNLEVFKANEDALKQLQLVLRVNREILNNMTKRGSA